MNSSFYTFQQAIFPQANRYKNTLQSATISEQPSIFRPFPYSERHLQCLWADSHYRPQVLSTTDGEPITVEHPGNWNLEAGPDFLNAALLVGDPPRRIQGDLEIHIHPNSWQQHGHDKDLRYQNVRFHITYFDGPSIPGLLHVPLHIALGSLPYSPLSKIDISAYPYAIPSGNFPLKEMHPGQRAEWLEAAGEERLRIKAERFALILQHKEPDQLLYEELLRSLGYKNNKTAFLQIAKQLPVSRLKQRASEPIDMYALLLGLSGLLPAQTNSSWDDSTRFFIRRIWDFWWKQNKDLNELALSEESWNLSGIRPANYPVRRLMAAAHLIHQWAPFIDSFQSIKKTKRCLIGVEDAYWSHHLTWTSPCKQTALIGASRANAIITNVIVPWLAATGQVKPFNKGLLKELPAEPTNNIIRQTAHTLFGPDHNPKIYRSSLAKQGLIQVFHDYLITHRLDEIKIKTI